MILVKAVLTLKTIEDEETEEGAIYQRYLNFFTLDADHVDYSVSRSDVQDVRNECE